MADAGELLFLEETTATEEDDDEDEGFLSGDIVFTCHFRDRRG